MKAHQTTWMQGLCVKVMARLLGKQHLYMTLGMVNICTVKAREFNPSSFPLPVSFCSRRLSTEDNKTIKTQKKRDAALLSSACVCVVVLWQLQSLDLFSALAGRRGALYNRVTPRRRLSSGVFSEHAYLFSDNSLSSLNRTRR